MMQAYLRRTSPPGLSRKYFGGGFSAKSSASMYTSRVSSTGRALGCSSWGLSSASHGDDLALGNVGQDDLDRPQDGQSAQGDRLSASRTVCSNSAISVTLSYFVTPTPGHEAAQGARRVCPRRRMPLIVGMRGSSQPATAFSFTSWISLRLETIV